MSDSNRVPVAISFAMRVRPSQDVLGNVWQDQALILDMKTERFFGLDEVATAMGMALTKSASVEAAYEALLAEYDVPPERLRQDLQELAEQLVEHGVLEACDG